MRETPVETARLGGMVASMVRDRLLWGGNVVPCKATDRATPGGSVVPQVTVSCRPVSGELDWLVRVATVAFWPGPGGMTSVARLLPGASQGDAMVRTRAGTTLNESCGEVEPAQRSNKNESGQPVRRQPGSGTVNDGSC